MRNRWKLWLILVLLMVPVLVQAEENGGSIRLVMRYHGSTVSGGSIKLYDVTDMDCSVEPETLVQILQTLGTDGLTEAIGNDGTACFSNLHTGYYLLVQEEAAPGYLEMKPFYISIPAVTGDQQQYHVEAAPKLQRIPEAQLPQTGQRNWPVWILLCSGLTAVGLGLLLLKQN